MIPVLENRWLLNDTVLKYYGLRKKPYTFKNTIKISVSTSNIIKSFDGIKDMSEYRTNCQIKKLIRDKIIIDIHSKKSVPETIDSAVFCTNCCSNDYIIPGLELNNEGLCPVCANMSSLKKLKDVLPVVNTISHNDASVFDVALFYTGGKDSTFLLYYLTQVLRLKVLALTWHTPFMSSNSITSMKNAQRIFTNTNFISKKLTSDDQKAIYKKSYELMKNTCICPFAAYPLFIDDLRNFNVKYLVLGNEPAQPINLLFNRLSPKILYNPIFQTIYRTLYNIIRIFRGKKKLIKGQIEMLLLLETLAFGKPDYIKTNTIRNPLIRNIHESLKQAEIFMGKFQQTVKQSSIDGNIPALIHIDFNEILPDGYVWKDIKTLLKEKAGWNDSSKENISLHTSCQIEKCKEFSQYQSFKDMNSDIIPFSALELSIAVNLGSLTREDAIREIKFNSGFSDTAPAETEIMKNAFM